MLPSGSRALGAADSRLRCRWRQRSNLSFECGDLCLLFLDGLNKDRDEVALLEAVRLARASWRSDSLGDYSRDLLRDQADLRLAYVERKVLADGAFRG